MRSHCSVFVLIAVSLSCAERQIVKVSDSAGQSVQGARVQAVSLSLNSTPNITDAQGEATVPSMVQGAKWISVSKAGFETIQVDMPKQWPLRVTLKPQASA